MGAHNQYHRHAAAAKHRRRIAEQADDEEALLQSLIARFSPTAIYTETLTDFPPVNTDIDTKPTPINIPGTTTPPPPPRPRPTDLNTSINTPPPVDTDTDIDTPTTTIININPNTATNIVVNSNTNINTLPVQQQSNTIAITPPPNTPTNTGRPTTTRTVSQTTRSLESAASSATPTKEPGSGSNVGGIVGGLAGGLLGLVVVVFVIRFILRRKSRQNASDADFNSTDFKNTATLMNDPPTHGETIERGFNPRPPSMVAQRLASPAPTFGAQYGAPGPYGGHFNGNEYNNMQQYGQNHSYASEQLMNNMSPQFATSPYPMYSNHTYTQSPFSPIGSPASSVANYEPARDEPVQPLSNPYLTRQPSAGVQLSRHPSADTMNSSSYGPQNGNASGQAQYVNYPTQAEYVDLDRSSVTPFQAAQYVEISKKLNTEVPVGLDTPAVDKIIQHKNDDLPPIPVEDTASPFDDPAPAPGINQTAHSSSEPSDSMDSTIPNPHDFPAPPSSAHTRVDSTPPTLPEILVESRVTSYDFASSARGSGTALSPLGSGFPSGLTAAGKGFASSPLSNQFPITPSPMASSFTIDSPPPAATSFTTTASTPAVALNATPAMKAEDKKRPETIYDDDDVYGGI